MGRLPSSADFPANLELQIIPPPNGDQPTNVLVLLHGLGDRHASFANLAKQMNLPETACVSIQGPNPLLDLGGFHWGDDIVFDSNSGGLDVDAGFQRSTALLGTVVTDALVAKCGYQPREVLFFGYGQGGMAALNVAISLHQSTSTRSAAELGGVISIGAGVPSAAAASLDPLCGTPVLVCAGNNQSAVTSAAEDKLKRVFSSVHVARYRRPGDSMPASRGEMTPIMQFFARRLRSTKGVPAGSIEVS